MTRTGWITASLTVLVVAVLAVGAWLLTSAGTSPEASSPRPEHTVEGKGCSESTIEVATARELIQALESAAPGDVITLAPGVYAGNFVAMTDGTAEAPIELCGTADSVLDGENPKDGYVVHLDGVNHWIVSGFTVRNGQKGVMADGMTNSIIRGLTVSNIGDEAIHLRKFSTDNVVENNTVSDTGLRKPKFGEGIYIGTAESNWCDITDCEPDRSDRNVIRGNTISATTSESVDIKEGTSDGILEGNTFDGSSIVEADSWVDVKGNNWLIEANTGTSSPLDGFQTHEILDGWGTGNVFSNNSAQVDGAGLGFALTPERDNVVECNNTVSNADEGLSNAECRD